MASTDFEHYRRHIQKSLAQLEPIFARATVGDFTHNVPIPSHEDELSEFFVGVQLMLDVVREKIATNEESVQRLSVANEALANDKALDEAVLSSLGEGIITMDHEQRVTFINQIAADLLGWDRQAALGRSYFEVAPLQDRFGHLIEGPNRPIMAALYRGERIDSGLSAHLSFVRVDGSTLPVSIVATPIRLGSRVIGAVSAFRDITDEIDLDRSKNEIISIASHQLRTPLTTIKWYSETALAQPELKAESKLQHYLATIHSANQRMIELVDALLSVSRLEMGSMHLLPKLLDVAAAAQTVISDLAPLIRQKQLVVTINTTPRKPRPILIDPESIRIVLQNLLSNAVRYTPAEGHITVSIAIKAGGLSLTVADTGYGIPKNQQAKIFGKLFRADNARRIATDGSGLGLYVTKSIIEHLNGKISFTSEENKGTTFYITIPPQPAGPVSSTTNPKEFKSHASSR